MNSAIEILLADDDPVLLELLPAQLTAKDLRFTTAETGRATIESIADAEYDVVLLDVDLPDISGLKLLSEIRHSENFPEVIMLTADKSLKSGVDAMKSGAYDYVTKPAEPEEVEAVIRKAAEKHRLVRQNEKLRAAVRRQNASLTVRPIYASSSMKKIFSQAERVSNLDTTLLITGESGTGKDVLARWVHSQSSRGEFPLISVNCGALPENLFESEFFGYEKGAFTGASKQKIGLIEAADGSTLFLDEIGEMPIPMQVKLLHFLENGNFRRVGATSDRKSDVRIIAATNKDLGEEIRSGNFRSDLFYRLNVIAFHIPPLRDRRDDIPALVEFFLEALAQSYNRAGLTISRRANTQLLNHLWQGNIRELKNTLERTVALSEGNTIDEIFGLDEQRDHFEDKGTTAGFELIPLAEVEKRHIIKTLEKVDGQREKAASILGITSRTLYRKLKEYEN